MNAGIRVKNVEIPNHTYNLESFIPKAHFSVTSYLLVFLAAAALYILTCSPGLEWQDAGLIQYRVLHNDIEGKLGLALSHPLYYLIMIPFKYIQIDEFVYRINCVNALISAFAIANLFLLLKLWLGETYPAFLGATTFALSHTFWLHSAIPETYGLVVALLLLELVMLLKYARTAQPKYLYFLAFINGLAIANHMMASLSFICYFILVFILVIKRELKFRHVIVMGLFWIVGALPYEYLIVKNIIATGDYAGTISSALFGLRWKTAVLNTSLSWSIVNENLLYIALNFPTPNILLFFVGIWCIYKIAPKKWYATALIALSILYLAFAFRYTVQDRYAFFIPFYCMISIFIAIGAFRYLLKASGAHKFLFLIFCVIVIPAYIKAPEIARGLDLKIGSGRYIPYRDDSTYFIHPWKMDYREKINPEGALQFSLQALFTVKEPAIIYADSTTASPLLLTQELRNYRKDDVKIISGIGSTVDSPEFNAQTIDQLFSHWNIYVVSNLKGYCPDFLLENENYTITLEDIIWKVEKRQ